MQAETSVERRKKSQKVTGRGSDYRDLRESVCRKAQHIRRWHDDEHRQRLHIDPTVPRLAW